MDVETGRAATAGPGDVQNEGACLSGVIGFVILIVLRTKDLRSSK
jgi:hypothetical protein